jgi:hypothetical protein
MTDLLETLTFGPMLAVSWHLACAEVLTAWCDLLLGE